MRMDDWPSGSLLELELPVQPSGGLPSNWLESHAVLSIKAKLVSPRKLAESNAQFWPIKTPRSQVTGNYSRVALLLVLVVAMVAEATAFALLQLPTLGEKCNRAGRQ